MFAAGNMAISARRVCRNNCLPFRPSILAKLAGLGWVPDHDQSWVVAQHCLSQAWGVLKGALIKAWCFGTSQDACRLTWYSEALCLVSGPGMPRGALLPKRILGRKRTSVGHDGLLVAAFPSAPAGSADLAGWMCSTKAHLEWYSNLRETLMKPPTLPWAAGGIPKSTDSCRVHQIIYWAFPTIRSVAWSGWSLWNEGACLLVPLATGFQVTGKGYFILGNVWSLMFACLV